ncbi:MAG: YncE family protein, partial [Chloroflexota bacterium]|nr:YncE family protein [Chloroflexota bacterium]
MRRLGILVLVGALALTFAGSPASRAATVSSAWPVGVAPFGLALDDTTGKVYVANSDTYSNPGLTTGTVSVVDPVTGSVGTLRTTQIPDQVLADSANRRLYASNYNFASMQRSLDVFDMESGARLASLPVGGFGMALDQTTGRLFVCESGALKVIDTGTFAVVATVSAPFNTFWWNVAADPDRHHLYVTNIREDSPTFFVLDDRDLTILAEIPLATATRFGVVVDPVTHYVYVTGGQYDQTGQLTSAFSVIDPESLSVVHAISMPGFALGIALAPARHRIYVSDHSGWRLYGIDDRTFDVAETINQDRFAPGLLLMHPDGRLYVGDSNDQSRGNGTLVALDLDNHAPVFQSVTLSPSTVFTGDMLHVQAVAFDPDLRRYPAPDPTTYTYEWSRNGNVLAGATGPTLDLSVAGNGDRGDTISVRVTASDGQLRSVASTSIAIRDSAPVATVSVSDTAPATNAVLSARAIANDADNDPMTYRFIWRVNGVVRRTTVAGPSASDSFDLGVGGNGNHG